MIPRLATLAWMGMIAASAFGLYTVKYRVHALHEEITRVSRELEDERENLHVVAAEWAYLNRPERLQQLATKYLTDLRPASGEQFGHIAMLPFPGQETPQSQVQTVPAIIPASHPGEE